MSQLIVGRSGSNRDLTIRARFLEEGRLPEHSEESTIFRSWRRCRSGGVDPSLLAPSTILERDLLAEQRQRQGALLRAAAPLLEGLHEELADQRMIVHLADRQGLILDAYSDSATYAHASEQGLIPGGDWSELTAGTNAIGTALAENRAVQVRGAEHFCNGPLKWSCAAAPVHGPARGELLGVLNVSTAAECDCGLVLPLIRSVARNLEQSIMLDMQARHQRLLGLSVDQLGYRDGVVLFDQDGRFVQANRHGAELLSSARIGLAEPAVRTDPSTTGLPSQGGPLLRLLPPSMVEPLWQRHELVGYMAVLPRGSELFETGDHRPTQGDADCPATCYLGGMPTLRRPLERLLRNAQRLLAMTPPPPRPARLQHLLASSIDFAHALEALANPEADSGKSRFNTREVILAVIDKIRHDHPQHVNIHLDWPPSLLLQGDPRCFNQLIFNLLENSCCHGFGGDRAGSIQLKGRSEAQGIVLTYRDDGRGMDQATLIQWDEPFFSTDPGHRQGLGGFINRMLVQHLYRGTMVVDSHPGRGMECRMTLGF